MFQPFLTDDGKVEGVLSQAKAVPQLDGITAAVLLLTAGDGQLTAAVRALNGDVGQALLDLTTHSYNVLCACEARSQCDPVYTAHHSQSTSLQQLH